MIEEENEDEEVSSDDIEREGDDEREELRKKQARVDELQAKIDAKFKAGTEVTPGGKVDFEACIAFFDEKAEQAQNEEGLGDKEAEEIDYFISRYENSAAITQVLWQLYFLKLELQSEQAMLAQLEAKLI